MSDDAERPLEAAGRPVEPVSAPNGGNGAETPLLDPETAEDGERKSAPTGALFHGLNVLVTNAVPDGAAVVLTEETLRDAFAKLEEAETRHRAERAERTNLFFARFPVDFFYARLTPQERVFLTAYADAYIDGATFHPAVGAQINAILYALDERVAEWRREEAQQQ